MQEKLSLEQFKELMDQIKTIVMKSGETYEEGKKDPSFDSNELEKKLVEQYLAIQEKILSYDLSDIPFEAWEGFLVLPIEGQYVDFSRTHANIDFGIIEFEIRGNFKGCKVRNLDKLANFDSNDFDEEVIRNNPDIFLSDLFTEEFKRKYYNDSLTITDLASLSAEALSELKRKNFTPHFDRHNFDRFLTDGIGIDKVIALYNYSVEEYEAVNKLLNTDTYYKYLPNSIVGSINDLLRQLASADVSQMKSICFDYIKKQLLSDKFRTLTTTGLPELFIKENEILFLINVDIPEDVKNRYFEKKLTISDIVTYYDVFKDIPVDFLFSDSCITDKVVPVYGLGQLQKLIIAHPDFFNFLEENNDLYNFSKLLDVNSNDIEICFIEAVKSYFISFRLPQNFRSVVDGNIVYNVPEWLSSMNFSFVDRILSIDQIANLDRSTVVLDYEQSNFIHIFGIENIVRFEQETGFFSHTRNLNSQNMEVFNSLAHILKNYRAQRYTSSTLYDSIDFKGGTLSYDEFLIAIAEFFDIARKSNVFSDIPCYNWMQGDFREMHPELFIDTNAPKELITAFYNNKITPAFLFGHPEYIPFLLNKNLDNVINSSMEIKNDVDPSVNYSINGTETIPFISNYIKRFGNEKLLNLMVTYGDILSRITLFNVHMLEDSEEKIENAIQNAIHSRLINEKYNYSYLASVYEISARYPELFINLDALDNIPISEKARLSKDFYSKCLHYEDIQTYPELLDVLKDKNLINAFGLRFGENRSTVTKDDKNPNSTKYNEIDLLNTLGNEKFLRLCLRYGRYFGGICSRLSQLTSISDGKIIQNFAKEEISFEQLCGLIESKIMDACVSGDFPYQPYDAPSFLRKSHPELFLAADAPEELKRYFYHNPNYPFSFEILSKHKEWKPYLEGKAIYTALMQTSYLKADVILYFKLFGEEKAIKLGLSKGETVTEMMRAHQVELMKKWYDKTGQKFIPDFVVMLNMDINEADKFLDAGSNWSTLMRNKSFASTPEAREAMLKLAYSFGVFDYDIKGFKKLQELLTSLPKKVDQNLGSIFARLDEIIAIYSQVKVFYYKELSDEEAYLATLEYIKKTHFIDMIDDKLLLNLFEALHKELPNIELDKDIFSQLYRLNDDGSYTLTINVQNYPKSAQAIRQILEKVGTFPMITPDNAHHYLGGFKLSYDPVFREFFLKNLDLILQDNKYFSRISEIQRRFDEIKTKYSNVPYTLDDVISYISANRYENVGIGNESVTQEAATNGYDQGDFETLQQIFNYAKQRTFSSIPRVEGRNEKYTYEITRLDNPVAMSIGKTTDCCQRLHEPGRQCMEHSMVDKNGRLFLVMDNEGCVVAQSWVWRRGDVICFDNIEVPDRQMWTHGIPRGQEDVGIRNEFTDEVLEVYRQAAREMMEIENETYRQLLESGKITQEQYDGLRVGKITIGLGYSNIKGSFSTLKTDTEIARPLHFEPPVDIGGNFYTSDSSTQYIVEERIDRKKYDGEMIHVYADSVVEHTDDSLDEISLRTLNSLESATRLDDSYLETRLSTNADPKTLVSQIAQKYRLDPSVTRIIVKPNFAIIYEDYGDSIKIADLFYNLSINNGLEHRDITNVVLVQLRIALDQIGKGKNIDISNLDDNQKEIYTRAVELADELDEERGISRGR